MEKSEETKMHKILAVDDEPGNVVLLKNILESSGYKILPAFSGKQALEVAMEEKPDLILLDVMMPEISGFEVCRFLTSDDRTSHIPVIMVTALTDSSDLKKGFESGAFDYVKKPIDITELRARVKAALRFSESQKIIREYEKAETYTATIVTANHEFKQPLTLIKLCTSALRRESRKDEISSGMILKRAEAIEGAANKIIDLLDVLSNVKKPKLVEYINDKKMIDFRKENGLAEVAEAG